ncbi:MAG: hypothetical protein AAF688_05495 [Bacteroidota bacterium]
MKKYLSLIVLTSALVFSQLSFSQNRIEIDKAANAKTKELRKTVKFEQNKMRDVFKAYQAFETTYQKIDDNLDANKERLKKIKEILDNDLKQILSPEEYERYLSISREDS